MTPTPRAPRDWVSAGTWPDVVFHADAPAAASYAARIASTLVQLCETEAERQGLARRAGIDVADLEALIEGTIWPTIHLLVRVETTIGRSLWP